MPTYRKKMSIRRRKPKSKSGMVSDSVKKYVKSVTKKALPEMKFSASITPVTEPVVLLTSATNIGYNWTEFGNISQGTTVSTRVGNKMNLQGYHSKIAYNNNSTVPVFVRRLIVGYSVSDLDAGTDSAELFTISGTGLSLLNIGNVVTALQAPINPVHYKVYFDKTFKLGPSSATDGANTRMINYFQKFGGKRITFEGTASGVLAQDFRFAEIILCVCANNDQTASSSVEFNRFSRTYFTDP